LNIEFEYLNIEFEYLNIEPEYLDTFSRLILLLLSKIKFLKYTIRFIVYLLYYYTVLSYLEKSKGDIFTPRTTSKKINKILYETNFSRMRMMFERNRLVLKIHPEFNSLSNSNQEKLLTRNQLAAVALSVIQVNSLNSFNYLFFTYSKIWGLLEDWMIIFIFLMLTLMFTVISYFIIASQ
jgi:hypothetical protein